MQGILRSKWTASWCWTMEAVENRMVVDSQWQPLYKSLCRCGECDGDIYEGDYYFDFRGDVVCENCVSDYIKERFRRCADGL